MRTFPPSTHNNSIKGTPVLPRKWLTLSGQWELNGAQDQAAVEAWLCTSKTGKRGASRTYSDVAIQAMASLRALFHLPGRSLEGFL